MALMAKAAVARRERARVKESSKGTRAGAHGSPTGMKDGAVGHHGACGILVFNQMCTMCTSM